MLLLEGGGIPGSLDYGVGSAPKPKEGGSNTLIAVSPNNEGVARISGVDLISLKIHAQIINKPLTVMLKKDGFTWTEDAKSAFQTLKTTMCNSPVSRLTNFSQPFMVETDVSNLGIGTVLMQEDRPLAYLSKALSTRNRCKSTYEKELLPSFLRLTSSDTT